MAIREMVRIDEDKCNGCGLCVPSCAEGAIQMINGKAKLVADNLCDGLGACLGDCPQGAITIEKREADEFDEIAVEKRLEEIGREPLPHSHPVPASGGCPSARVVNFASQPAAADEQAGQRPSELRQWPVQLHLVPPTAPFLQGKEVLLAADCVPFAYADFHKDMLRDKALLIACPKLDNTAPYVAKLVTMLQQSNIKKLIVAHMEVPCCSGLVALARQAISESGVAVPFETIKVGIQGELK